MKPELQSEITCPHCGHRKVETMPTDACQFFYDCEGCGAILRPKTGDCCVFCSYGSVPCPPIQLEGHCYAPEKTMKKIEVYDPAMCCSTGVCGPQIDPLLVAFAADLKWVAEQGVTVQRYNLSQEPQAFAANSAVVKEMEASMDRLPIIAIDGHIIATGRYLSRDQLAQKLGLSVGEKSGPTASCCSPKSGCC